MSVLISPAALRGAAADGALIVGDGLSTASVEGQEVSDDRWSLTVHRICQGDREAVEQLYLYFGRGIRLFLLRQVGPQELEDRVHDAFLLVVGAIRRGEIRNPSRLPGFIRTVLRRQVADHTRAAVHERRTCIDAETAYDLRDGHRSPEDVFNLKQRVALMHGMLQQLDGVDRDLLVRFYINEEAPEAICAALNMSVGQFRLRKWRAKARFGTLARRLLAHRALSKLQESTGRFPGNRLAENSKEMKIGVRKAAPPTH